MGLDRGVVKYIEYFEIVDRLLPLLSLLLLLFSSLPGVLLVTLQLFGTLFFTTQSMLTYLKSKLRLLCQLASLGIIVIAQAQKEVEDSTIYNKPFYDACAQGTLEQVQEFLSKDQSLAIAATPDGETCLHLTAISKNVDVAKLLLEMGADVNHRVTHARGLRMNPLSWHVYSGNDEIVKLLLDNGADINMEFDLNEEKQKATVMDVSLLLMESSPDYFGKTHELLISSGGKRFDELNEI